MSDEKQEIAVRNRELLDREKHFKDLVVPVEFNVKTRIATHIYGNSLGDYPVKQIDFSPSYGIRGGDCIRAYLVAGEYVSMEDFEGVVPIQGKESRLVSYVGGGKKVLPRVLVGRDLRETERAYMVDILNPEGRIISRDADPGKMKADYGGDAWEWLSGTSEDFANYNLDKRGPLVKSPLGSLVRCHGSEGRGDEIPQGGWELGGLD